ncbi:MAG: substrate-binding domain-containing protein, partial [Desulfurivibrio sp.]
PLPGPKVLKISGCSVSRTGYLEQLSAAFTAKTGIRVVIKGGGSMAGLLTLEADAADLAASCLPPEAADIPAGIRLVPVAGDALVFITHRDNPLADISLEQVRDIFLGRVHNWQQLGGPDRPLALYLPYSHYAGSSNGAANHGVSYVLQQQVLGGRTVSPDPRGFFPRPSGGLAEESVARDPAGFSVSGFTSVRTRSEKLKMLAVEGVAANRENIVNGAYPGQLRRHLYLGLADAAPPAAHLFLEFMLSPEGQDILTATGAISLGELP